MKKKFVFGVGVLASVMLLVFAFNTFAGGSSSCNVKGKGGGSGKGGGAVDSSCQEDDEEEGRGDLRVKIKVYDINGNPTGEIIERSKVKLYNKKGKKKDEDKTNFKGEANFYDVKEGKYRVKCEVPGYVKLTEPHKDYYRTGLVKIKDGKRAEKTCHLRKK